MSPYFQLILLLTAVGHVAAVSGSPADPLDAILRRSHLSQGAYGIDIRELRSGKSVYSRNENAPLNPASGIKLLITAASLSKLGPNHRFETRVALSGKDLCLIGGGDPSLVHEQLLSLVDSVKRAGLMNVEGDLLVDQSLFAPSRENLEEFESDQDRAFTAPIAPLSLDFNSVAIHAAPSGVGQAPLVSIEPDVPVFAVRNRAKTVAKAGPKDLGASVTQEKDSLNVELFGKIGAETGERTIYRALPSPDLFVAHAFLDLFRKAGGSVRGKIKTGRCPEPFTREVRFPSKPLSQIVFDLNKFSNNFIAEMLLRAVGSEPTRESGLDAIRVWLAEKRIAAPERRQENASGLSKETRISARTLVEVIRAAANDFKTGPEFTASLGIGGVDGTLKRHFGDPPIRGNVRGKSGMLDSVVSLSGLAQSPAYGTVAFSMIFNTHEKDSFSLLKLEEELLRAVVTEKSK